MKGARALLRSLSIRYQVALGVAVGVALVTLLFGLLAAYNLEQALDSAKEQRLDQVLGIASALDSMDAPSIDEGGFHQALRSWVLGSAGLAAVVVDAHGNIVATSEAAGNSPGIEPDLRVLADLAGEGKAGVRVYDVPGGSHIVAYAPFHRAGGGAAVVEELEEGAVSFLSELLRFLPYFGIGALVLTSVSAWIHAHYTVRPLAQLERAAARIAGGQLDEPVTTTRRDEIGRLAASFDIMRQELKEAHEARLWWEQRLQQRVREQAQEVRRLMARAINAQEEERRRLAQELHDDTAQAVATLLMRVDALRDSLSSDQEQVRRYVEPAVAQGTRALEDLRRVIMGLRPAALDDLGLVAALRSYASAVLVPAGVQPEISVQGEGRRPSKAEEVALFRILQEAMNNVARHAQAKNATLRLDFRDSQVVATVADDGRGFDVAEARARGSGLGLVGMQERADIVNAELQVTSAPGKGTEVKVTLHLQEEANAIGESGTRG